MFMNPIPNGWNIVVEEGLGNPGFPCEYRTCTDANQVTMLVQHKHVGSYSN